MLDGLVEVPHVAYAVVVSTDGLIVQKSTSLLQDTAEIVAAGSASLYSIAAGVGRRIGSGPVDQIVVEYHDHILFLAAAGHHARLAVLCEPSVDMGTVAYEVRRLVTRIGEYLGTEARSSALTVNGLPGTGHGV
ncbi:roadblock/LC7 domain-containing protein [Dactylosporangium sp. NPDC051484]|uniref:roadblock/LC7 domain-containing protein n=1 Tax=Dactylosporangium sp. NPDC051484 TaxID=3154942 RepID=UPI00344F2D23